MYPAPPMQFNQSLRSLNEVCRSTPILISQQPEFVLSFGSDRRSRDGHLDGFG